MHKVGAFQVPSKTFLPLWGEKWYKDRKRHETIVFNTMYMLLLLHAANPDSISASVVVPKAHQERRLRAKPKGSPEYHWMWPKTQKEEERKNEDTRNSPVFWHAVKTGSTPAPHMMPWTPAGVLPEYRVGVNPEYSWARLKSHLTSPEKRNTDWSNNT